MAADEASLRPERRRGPLRWWIVAAVIATLVAAATITATIMLSRQPAWEPVPVPTVAPS